MSKRMRTWVRWLDEIANEDLAIVGGKALNLSRLRRAGFETPKGFVIDTTPLHGAKRQTEPNSLPQQAKDEVIASYRQLGAAAVAVRSSVTVEDSSTKSLAGQARTVLNVRTEEALLESVQTVFDSVDEAGLRSYAQRMGIAPHDVAMHVVVQKMVDAESAGVLFTVNPVSGDRNEMVINATWGLGEPLVSGKVTPDQITVDKATGKCTSYLVGGKEEILTSNGSGSTPADKADARCLDEEQIRRLVEVARNQRKGFSTSLDIVAPKSSNWQCRAGARTGSPFHEQLASSSQIDSAAESDKANNEPVDREATPQVAAETRLSQSAGSWGRVRREFVRSRLDIARRLFPLREVTKNYLMMEYELLRGPLVELDRRLELDGGIFYLHCDEIRPAVDGQPMQKLIHSRRRQHQLHQQLRLPQVLLGGQLSESQTVESEATVGGLKGIGVSSGTVEGRVRVLHSIDEIATVLKGEIVVVPSLDPTWTIVYARAAGLVARRGAILSHGAILAREFKLPAIANVPEAPSCLRDGQHVKINGTTGTIQFFDFETNHETGSLNTARSPGSSRVFR